jgi:hypothetical protein
MNRYLASSSTLSYLRVVFGIFIFTARLPEEQTEFESLLWCFYPALLVLFTPLSLASAAGSAGWPKLRQLQYITQSDITSTGTLTFLWCSFRVRHMPTFFRNLLFANKQKLDHVI